MRLSLLFLFVFLAACDFDGPFNPIPCRYDLSGLHDTLKPYGLWTWGEAPLGFRSKSAYDPADIDSTTWTICLGIDSPNNYFFSEPFVMMLAKKVFDDPANAYFQHITFELKQRVASNGTAILTYVVDRNTDTIGLRSILATDNARIVSEGSAGIAYSGKYGTWKTKALTIDSIPVVPLPIVYKYWLAHPQYRDIDVQVQHASSRLCVGVRYQFWFESSMP